MGLRQKPIAMHQTIYKRRCYRHSFAVYAVLFLNALFGGRHFLVNEEYFCVLTISLCVSAFWGSPIVTQIH